MVKTREKQSRQIKIPLPQVPAGLDSLVTSYLDSLRRALEENLRTLFYKEAIDGARLIDGSVLDGSLDTPIDFDVPLVDMAISESGGTITWAAGTIHFGGTSYAVAGSSASSGTQGALEWVEAGTILTYNTSPTAKADTWIIAHWDGTRFNRAVTATILHGGLIQATTITGDRLVIGTITTTELNFTPLFSFGGTGAVIATINASSEGINIDADNIAISGATTFDSGFDPTTKVDEVGGTYDSAASGARVRIFPDANTGIQIIDDAATDVFKVIVGGTNVGDVIIGDFVGGSGVKWDKGAGTFEIKGNLGLLGDVNNFYDITNKRIKLGDGTDYVEITDVDGIIVHSGGTGKDTTLERYSDVVGTGPEFLYRKSHHATSITTTVTNEALGRTFYQGVSLNNDFVAGAEVTIQQVGTALSGGVATKFTFQNTTSAGGIVSLVFDESGDLTVPGSILTASIAAGLIDSGIIMEPRGGTGQNTYTRGDFLYSASTNSLAKLPIGTAGQMLAVTASGLDPVWRNGVQAKTYTGSNSAIDAVRVSFDFTPSLVIIQGTRDSAGITREAVLVWGPSGAVSNRRANGNDIGTDDVYLSGKDVKTKTIANEVNAAESYLAIAIG